MLRTTCQNFQHILFTQCFGDDVRAVIILFSFFCPICSSVHSSSVPLSLYLFTYLIGNTKLSAVAALTEDTWIPTRFRSHVTSLRCRSCWKGGNFCVVQWMLTLGSEVFWHWKLRFVYRAVITMMFFLIGMQRLCEVRAAILYTDLISLVA